MKLSAATRLTRVFWLALFAVELCAVAAGAADPAAAARPNFVVILIDDKY
jgi:hypothetical protein